MSSCVSYFLLIYVDGEEGGRVEDVRTFVSLNFYCVGGKILIVAYRRTPFFNGSFVENT